MLLLKSVHIACVALWLGNFVVTGVWSARAFLARDRALERFAVREILFTDAVFTLAGGAAVVISGIALASMEGVAPLRTAWTLWGLSIAVASAVVWLAALLPLELRMHKLAARAEVSLHALFAWWSVIGWAVTAALFAVIYLMVAKPT